MTVNYTTLLGLAQPVTGTEANTWGDVVNDEITALIEEAIAGGETIDVTANNVTLTDTDGAANQARNAILLITGTPGTPRNVVAPSASKVYIVKNSSDAAVVLKGSATTGVAIPVGVEALCFWNGSDFEIVGVNGPASSTDNAVARFDSTTGKVIQNSGVTIDDSNNVSGVAQLNATTIDTTNIEVTNIKAKDGTASASIADSTGVFTHATTTVFPAGAVGTPAITTTGDTNTGIFFPAADTIAFAEGGAEAMRIDSSGNAIFGNAIYFNTPSSGTTNAYGFITYTSAGSVNIYADNGSAYANSLISMNVDGSERMRIDSSGRLTVGPESASNRTSYQTQLSASDENVLSVQQPVNTVGAKSSIGFWGRNSNNAAVIYSKVNSEIVTNTAGSTAGSLVFSTVGANTLTERMRIDSSGNVGIGAVGAGTSSATPINLNLGSTFASTAGDALKTKLRVFQDNSNNIYGFGVSSGLLESHVPSSAGYAWYINNTGRMRIDSSGNVFFTKTASDVTVAGMEYAATGRMILTTATNLEPLLLNRQSSDGTLIEFRQANTVEGSISVSGNTVSYNAFSGGHWSQLQQGRGYNPDIPRGTVMSTIGEMCLWKSVEWTETTEHPAIPAVEAKEAVLDDEGNVIEPAVEAVEGKDAWTETSDKRETYLGDLPVGATFEEDGFTKTVVDDGNERLPKVKVSDVVGDKAVYGVFQTWDEAQDMLVTSLGAFVVRIAAGVTVEIGDLLESNGDGCAKVQDDDVIRSKTIAKVTSTTPTATYDDGSYTVPAVIYCG